MEKTRRHTMKYIFYIICLSALASCAPLQIISYDQPFVRIYDSLPGTKSQLFIKANDWMIKTFNDAESVIQFTDREEGAVIGKYLLFGDLSVGLYGTQTDNRVYAKIDIRIKDNKARLSIEPLGSWRYDPSGMTIYKFGKESAMTEMEQLAKDLHKALTANVVEF